MNKIEKIKHEILKELIKNNCSLPSEFAVELTIKKTAKAIFRDIEKGIDKMQKLVEKTLKGDDDELSYACGEGEVMGLDLAKGVINELKRKWLGDEQ